MHVKQPPRAGTLVKVVDILGDQQQLATPFCIELRERLMGRVGLNRAELRAASIVKGMNQLRIASIRLGRTDIFHAVAFPKTVGTAKSRKATLSRNTRTSEHHDVPYVGMIHRRSLEAQRRARKKPCATRSHVVVSRPDHPRRPQPKRGTSMHKVVPITLAVAAAVASTGCTKGAEAAVDTTKIVDS